MERRGAAEVIAIDIEDPQPLGLAAAHAVRPRRRRSPRVPARSSSPARPRSRSQRRRWTRASSASTVSVYDLDPETDGTFDFVFLGSLLLHLRDPIRALDRVRAVCSGEAVIAETVELIPSLLRPRTATARLEGIDQSWWWQPNVAGFRRMVSSAGFEILEKTGIYYLPTGAAHPRPPWRTAWRSALVPAGVRSS